MQLSPIKSILLILAFIFSFSLMNYGGLAKAMTTMSQDYSTKESIPMGSMVSLEDNSNDHVIASTHKTSDGIIGVVIGNNNIKNKELAQKVEDYLVTTEPSGSITPHISFSTAKQKELESQARAESLKDAKTKAENTVKQLNVRLGKAQSVSDITSIGFNPFPWYGYDMAVDSSDAVSESKEQSYDIQPGLDEYSFSIKVVYELK